MTKSKASEEATAVQPEAASESKPRQADLTNIDDIRALIAQLENERNQHEAKANLVAGQLIILYELRKGHGG